MRRRQLLATLGGLAAGSGACAAGSGVAGARAGATSPSFSVDVEAPERVVVGDGATIEVSTTNESSVEATVELEVEVDGDVVREDTATLDPRGTHVATVRVPADEAGEIAWEAQTQHDSASGIVEVRRSPDEATDEGTADGAADEASDESAGEAPADEPASSIAEPETAGGVVVGLGALALLGEFARRRL